MYRHSARFKNIQQTTISQSFRIYADSSRGYRITVQGNYKETILSRFTKGAWYLEPARPDVGYAATVAAACNPGSVKDLG